MKRRRIILGIATIGAMPILGLIALYNLPVSIALGPCLKDWTSPSSYSPRASKLATVDFEVGGEPIRVCYGRPSARGRQVFGNLVPHDRLWRTGANEPTRLFTAIPLEIGALRLEPGRYSIYTRPAVDTWDVFFSESTFHWGNDLNSAVRARIGSTTVQVLTSPRLVDTLTITGVTGVTETTLVLEWENTRVEIPLRRGQF